MAKKKVAKTDLSESVHRIWLAGLGALATAEEEGGKLFAALVKKGKQYESSVKKPVDQATTRVKKKVKEVRGRAGKTVKQIERAFDDQVDAALHRVGVPTRKEIAALNRKVQRLTEALEGKRRKTTKKKTTARKKTAAK
jgi:poly(hydroxyalkanoate) granule-associated protein